MKRYNKFVSVVAASLVLFGGGFAQAAAIPDEQFVISNPPTDDRYTGINLADDNSAKNTFSALEAFTATGTSKESSILTRQTCQKIGSKGCEADKYFQYNAQLGMCDSKLTTDCVTRVFARDLSGKEIEGFFVENFPGNTEYSYPGDSSIGLPAGVSPFIVDFPTHPHAGGTNYLVVVWLQGARGFNESQFSVENFSTGIFAVSKVNGRYSMAKPADNQGNRPDHKLAGRQSTAGGFNMEQSTSRRSACVQTSPTQCLLPWPMPLDTSFGFSVKLHEKVTGWLHGRLTDAQSEITKTADGDQLLTIQGRPTLVPGIYAWFKKSDYPTPLKNYYRNQDVRQVNAGGLGWPKPGDESSMGPDGLPWSIMKEGFGYDEGGFKETLAWIDGVGDKAQYAQTVWSAKSISGQYTQCMKGTESLSGIVSTNSTMYIGNPPTFNLADQTLDYKVVSPHFLPNGSEFKGSYDLVIKSEVARCIYGFSSAPISATISVISSDGVAQVATTTFTEKKGWMYLTARNFTFSSPTVKVSLTQAGSTKTPKVSTITCFKGKTSKKVTGSKPVCPAGFKKK
ncbi:MAG: hypothetical protein NTY85_01705 [Actinobacteria bacterium]|nr:hypothetical protein [Actinomycetota bacterium]